MSSVDPEKRDVRAFLAFEIPSRVKQELAIVQQQWRETLPRARWVRPSNQHLTVKFLGETPPSALDELSEQLQAPLRGLGQVAVTLCGTGFFPSAARPRVAWIGGSAHGADEVAQIVNRVAATLGFEVDRKAWALHVTQARLRDPWRSPAVEAFLAAGEKLKLEPFTCLELVLFESVLSPSGAVYTPLERFQLGC
jgi:2'-5' RNA ligase